MHVVLLDFSAGFRDGQKQLVAKAQQMQAQGIPVLLACPHGSLFAAFLDSSESPELPHLFLRSLCGVPSWLYSLLPHLKTPGAELHVHGWQAARAACLIRRFLPVLPIHVTFRGTHLLRHTPSYFEARLLRAVFSAATTLSCITRELADTLTSLGAGTAKITFCLPIIPPQTPNPLPDGRFIFLAAAPLEPDSGCDELIDAMAMVQGTEDLPPWELRLVGQGSQFTALLDKATELGVESRLALLGEQDVDAQLAAAHIAVSTARRSREQFMFLFRAWARRLPVLCTGTPEMLQFVTDRQNALVSQPGNAVALGTNMVRCLANDELRMRISTGIQSAVEREGL